MLCTLACAGFEPPGPDARTKAIGDLSSLPENLRRAFVPGDEFEPIPKPGPHDWLSVHPEPGQSFDQFVASRPNRPDTIRKVIYLQPLGAFVPGYSPQVEKLQEFATAYFQMEVKVLPTAEGELMQFRSRTNRFTGRRQVLTSDVLGWLRRRLPSDAFCLLGITTVDLYPHESWNFVFGEASLHERVGVYSFARYDPEFYGERRTAEFGTLLLRRSCKVLAHETAHMFGLAHCIYFRCVLNGSNHLEESDSRPMHLCPVCLRKLHYSIGFDVVARYRALAEFYSSAGLNDEAQWVAARIRKLTGPSR
ncbi:MAG: archaemetzincin [Verrucomicrobiales bacterium]|nr:archaemetzincin [Verrucomicrobiales bacterium]